MSTITILHLPGCAGGQAAVEAAFGIATTRSDVTVEEIVIADQSEAIRRGFRGSPTVLVDGVDIEPDCQIPIGSMG
jgi:glutaredoxin